MMLSRADLADFLVVGEEGLVLTQTQCLRLAAVPTALLVYLEKPRTLEQATSHLDEAFGPAPEGRVRQILDNLIVHDLIREHPPLLSLLLSQDQVLSRDQVQS